ncbi:serine/threonine-protein kinase [Streptomyces sp. NBC_00838]|uniref:serine/threonine-protein kinase n=1 Tax=Streptomyces sp. NBC_00838 TaxID=2903680 RepID=UPI00386E32F2|nr:serine/threonine-protein kinase [Streptomyces sp. NBC_00838]
MDALRVQDPARIGAYVLLARLGAGGMGQVYLGRSPGGRLVAVKVVREEITGHPEALARFRREAETVRAVRSAYTANLIDAGLDSAPYWIATEYVTGPTLAHAVRERGPFPAGTCRRLIAAMAEGLASVHAYGVTHRDLKPQNVLLAAQGPQLIDFGIARGVEQTALTQDGQAPGTPGYTAPEVLARNEVGDAADIFALGATVAYAATGRAPFGVGDAATVSYRAVHEEIDTAGVEPALAALIRECVAKDPARRPGPAELIRRCAVDTALVDDPAYQPLVAMADAVPDTPRRPHHAPAPPLHDLPTQGPGGPAGPTPSLPARSSRRGIPWLVAIGTGAVIGVSVATAVWLLPGDGSGGGDGGDKAAGGAPGARSSSKSPAADDTAPAGPPRYIQDIGTSRHSWNGLRDRCNLPGEEEPPLQFQMSVTTAETDYTGELPPGKAEIGYRLKYEEPNLPPYYIAVEVKPPHRLDADGRPTTSGANSDRFGSVSRAADLYEGDETQWTYLTYPDDFSSRADGEVRPAPPLSADPGEWTVVYHHATSDTSHKSVLCTGFVSDGP